MIVLLTGATGFLGKPLVRRLISDGHEIRILTRNPKNFSTERLPKALVFAWPAGGPIPEEVWDGVDAVIHLAGENIGTWPWTADRKNRIRNSRVSGTRTLVEAMGRLKNPPRVFLSASAIGYYGDAGAKPCREADPPGDGFLAEVVRAWEAEIFKAEPIGIRTVAIRNGLILGRELDGPGPQGAVGGALGKMLPAFKFGLGALLGDGRQYWSWIHIEDTVGIFMHALTHSEISGVVNGCAPEPVTQSEFCHVLAATLHRPLFFQAPAFVLRLGLGGMADTLLQGQSADVGKLIASGYRFRFPSLTLALKNILTPS